MTIDSCLNFLRLQVNIDGCVNTLSGYCEGFFKDYGKDGRNYTARAIYDCFFDPTDEVEFCTILIYTIHLADIPFLVR